jgi:hypothetical protein
MLGVSYYDAEQDHRADTWEQKLHPVAGTFGYTSGRDAVDDLRARHNGRLPNPAYTRIVTEPVPVFDPRYHRTVTEPVPDGPRVPNPFGYPSDDELMAELRQRWAEEGRW